MTVDTSKSARDAFAALLRCPKCGRTGSALWEENSLMSPAGPNTMLAGVSSGFYRREPEDSHRPPQIVCQDCETVQPD